MNNTKNLTDLISYLPAISDGEEGDIVKALQTSLKRLGYYKDEIDGSAGKNTVKAIETFQIDNGLEIDGCFGPKCWTKLLTSKDSSTKEGSPLSKADCDAAFSIMETPSLAGVMKAGNKLGLDDTEMLALISWVQGEGYWGVDDPYLGYLSACVIINCILDGWYGRGQNVVDKIASWGPYYSEEKQIQRYTAGTMNDAAMKLTYLALTHLQKGVHCCYGPGYKPDNVFYDPHYVVHGKNIYIF